MKEFVPRQIQGNIQAWLDKPEALVLLGARQVGKTTLFKKLARDLEKKRKGQTVFVNFDDPRLRSQAQDDPVHFLERLIGPLPPKKRLFVFLDEFQKVPQILSGVKIFYDRSTPQIKFLLSGSASIAIKESISESLAGRAIKLPLFSFSFQEYLRAQNRTSKKTASAERQLENLFLDPSKFNPQNLQSLLLLEEAPLRRYFLDYLFKGGYPRVARTDDSGEILSLYQNIKEAYLDKDVRGLLKEEQLYHFEKLMEILAARIGNTISFEGTARDLQLSVHTVKNLASLLKYSYWLDFLHPLAFWGGEYKKAPKVYFHDTGFRNSLLRLLSLPPDRSLLGAVTENVTFNIISRFTAYKNYPAKINFWRTYGGAEVDFVLSGGGERSALEVKYKRFKKASLSRGIKTFVSKYKPRWCVILNQNLFAEESLGETTIWFLPLWAFALSV